MTASLVGCGSDSGSGGSGGTPGFGGMPGTGGTAGAGGGNGTATVSGTVYIASLDDVSTPLEGATVSVVGGASTTSGANGAFSLEAPVGIQMFLTTAPNAWGELQTGDVPAGGENMAEVEVVPDALVAAVSGALSQTIDPSKGIVAVEFDLETALGGESADLGSNYGFVFVFDAEGNPELGNALEAGADPIIIFANVDITSDVMPSVGGSCSLDFSGVSFPSQAKVFTVVDASCP
jgi:hypothetical protein